MFSEWHNGAKEYAIAFVVKYEDKLYVFTFGTNASCDYFEEVLGTTADAKATLCIKFDKDSDACKLTLGGALEGSTIADWTACDEDFEDLFGVVKTK